jgi:hypothetical protein
MTPDNEDVIDCEETMVDEDHPAYQAVVKRGGDGGSAGSMRKRTGGGDDSVLIEPDELFEHEAQPGHDDIAAEASAEKRRRFELEAIKVVMKAYDEGLALKDSRLLCQQRLDGLKQTELTLQQETQAFQAQVVKRQAILVAKKQKLSQDLKDAEAEVKAAEAATQVVYDDVDKLGSAIKCAHEDTIPDSQS